MRAVLNQKIFPNRIISNLKKEAAFLYYAICRENCADTFGKKVLK